MLTVNLPFKVSAIVLAAVLAACGKSTPEAPQRKAALPAATHSARPAVMRAKAVPAKPVGVPPAAHPGTEFRVTAVTLGNAVDGAEHIDKPATQFAAEDKTIYASVASIGVTRDTALNARWSYLEGAGQLISSVTQRLASEGPATTTFTLHNPDLWPEGKYQVQIAVDGKVVDTKAFSVSK